MYPLLRKNTYLLMLVCLTAAACTTQEHSSEPQKIAPKEEVAPEAGAPVLRGNAPVKNATIFFESDYAPDTEFAVNAKNVVGNQCGDFLSVKFTEQITSNTRSARANKVSIDSTSNLPVAVMARHHVEQKGLYSSCGPLTRVFVPEANTSYVAKLVKEKDRAGEDTGVCVLDIKKIDAASGKQRPVKTMAFSQCTA